MSAHGPPADLPHRDPGIPRFVVAVGVCAMVGAFLVVGRSRPTATAGPWAAPVATAQTDGGLTGAGLFLREGCGECHATSGPSTALGPSLAGIPRRAEGRLADPTYTGSATTAEGYVREATLDHCVDRLPGYDCPEVPDVGLRLSLDQVDRIVRFLVGLEGGEAP